MLILRRHLVNAGLLVGIAGTRPRTVIARDASPLARQRDFAIRALRSADLHPGWFTSENWANGAYAPWTDYLAGRISEGDFSRACAQTTDYCLRDIWNLRQQSGPEIKWSAEQKFNWNGVHVLSLRFFKTGEPAYVDRWLHVVRSFAQWSAAGVRDPRNPLNAGTPVSLLDAATVWGGIFTALAIICKGLGVQRTAGEPYGGSPYAPATGALDDAAMAMLPADTLIEVPAGFAASSAPLLAKWYAEPRYVPNQRVFGMEALAYLVSAFPDVAGVAPLSRALHATLADVFVRYRLPDGGQLEQSFNYNVDVIEAAQRISALSFRDGAPWHGDAEQTITGWNRLVAGLATPSGGLPQLGNSSWGRIGRDAPRTAFSATSLAFPFSGHYVQRSDWTPEAAYLYLFNRRAARGHTMAGSNSVQIAAFGQPLLVAGGSADYRAKPNDPSKSERYLDEHSSWKTNTILVDRQSQADGDTEGLARDPSNKPDILRAPQASIRARWLASDTFDFLEGIHRTGYGGTPGKPPGIVDVQHRRQAVFVRSLMMWVLVDRLIAGEEHEYFQVWKFAPTRGISGAIGFTKEQVVADSAGRRIRTQRGGADAVNVLLRHFGVPGMRYEPHFGDDYGWYGVGPTVDTVPSVDVHTVWRGSGPQVLVTLIVPYRGVQSPVNRLADNSTRESAQSLVEFADGSKLQITAPVAASRSGPPADRLELAVELSRPGGPDAQLRIFEGGGAEKVGSRTRPCIYPATLAWKTDGGSLSPSYTR